MIAELDTGTDLEQKAKGAMQALLSSVPGASIQIMDSASQDKWDFEVQLSTRAGLQTLLCEVKSRAWPNELYAIAHRFQRTILDKSIPVLIAPYISKQAAETCIELGLSWADFAGNGELRIEGAFIKVQGQPNPYKQGRGTASLYTPKSAQVVHALLLNPQRAWTIDDLAKTAVVSLGQVASVKKHLETNRWIRAVYGETILTEPRKLLDDWTLHYKPKRQTNRYFTMDSPPQLEARVAEIVPDAAFTEFSAAERYAPYTRHQRVAFYIPEWSEEDAKRLGLKSGDGATNVAVYQTGEPVPFTEERGNVRCVSPVLAYLDLKLLAGRGQDAAKHLLETEILPRWQ